MPQGVLPFQYAAERSSTGMTAMGEAGVYLDMVAAAGLWESVRRHVGIKGMSQGWTDIQMITSLVLLNVAGGESVSDLNVLEGDEGLGRLLRRMETHGMRRCEREAMEQRWLVGRQRSVPSASAVFRYLDKFHDAGEEAKPESTDGRREDSGRGVRELRARWPGLHWGRWEGGGRSSVAAQGPYGRLRGLRCAGW